MLEQEHYIYGQDGLKLYTFSWEVSLPKAIICIIPGFGEHIGRYHHVANHLTNNGYSVVGMDCRGHGKSEGLKGHAASLEILLDDIEELLKYVRSEYNELQLFLFGHSMGGNLVLNYVLKKPINEVAGFISSSPWLKLAVDPPEWKAKLGKFIAGIYPKIRLPSGLDVKALSKDEAVCKAYLEDPLVNNKISAGLFQHISDGAEYVIKNASEIKLDGLIYHGKADRVIDFETTSQTASKIGKNIKWIAYNGVYHEPHNDLEQGEVLNNIIDWLNFLLQKKGHPTSL